MAKYSRSAVKQNMKALFCFLSKAHEMAHISVPFLDLLILLKLKGRFWIKYFAIEISSLKSCPDGPISIPL